MRPGLAALVVAALVVLGGCVSAPELTPTERGSTPAANTATPPPGTDASPGDTSTATKRVDSTTGETRTVEPTTTRTPGTATPSNGERPDPPDDRLGWEGGFWHNESLSIDASDGLKADELAAVVNRTMARVERIRRLEFERTVPTDVISRAEFRERQNNGSLSRANRLHQNVKWEAMFMVGEDESAIRTQRSTIGSSIAGFYSPSRERIVIVSGNTDSPGVNEITLAHELVHALQYQHFTPGEYDQSTRELHNAKDGLLEGDATLVEQFYRQRCDGNWTCLPTPSSGDSGGTSSIHWGMYLVTYQPYSDGPAFVNALRRAGGWARVNAAYGNPPASTEQTIHPERYPDDVPVDRSFEDASGSGWRILDLTGGVDYASFGEAGLAVMLFYPFYDSGRMRSPIIGTGEFFNFTAAGRLSRFDPIAYGNAYTTGWDGDWLYPYVNDSSFGTNETGYVWKTVWDSPADAAEFLDGYEQLLAYYGATPVEGRESTYRITEPNPYADAFRVVIDGSTVTIVNAPTVEDLNEVRANAGS